MKKGLFIDLSHTIEDGLVTYKGLPAPIICDYWSREASKDWYDDGSSFQIGKIEMVANTGTYLDAPFHRYADGKDLSELTVAQCADLEGIVVRVPYNEHGLTIGKDVFEGLALKDKAVLVHTGWSAHWNTEAYYSGHPYLTQEAAVFLRDSGVKLVGIDSYNIDNTAEKKRPVHTTLLGSDVLIVEHMCNLEGLGEGSFRFTALPPKFKGVGTFPVRAFAKER